MQEKKTIKTKHNKKRNTAFLYEVVIREITKSILENDKRRKAYFVNVCKSFFSSGTILKKELDLYNSINNTYNLQESVADRLLREAKFEYDKLDKNKIFLEQTKLINILNKATSGKIFSNFVPDYKNLATISQIFNNTVPVKEKVLLETSLINKMSSDQEQTDNQKLEALDALTYKLFVKKFNEQYENTLLSEQKELITKYVMSFADNGVEFKLFLNEEIFRLKQSLNSLLNHKEISKDVLMKEKTNKLLEKVEKYKEREIDSQVIQEVLKIQNLVKEMNSEDNSTNG